MNNHKLIAINEYNEHNTLNEKKLLVINLMTYDISLASTCEDIKRIIFRSSDIDNHTFELSCYVIPDNYSVCHYTTQVDNEEEELHINFDFDCALSSTVKQSLFNIENKKIDMNSIYQNANLDIVTKYAGLCEIDYSYRTALNNLNASNCFSITDKELNRALNRDNTIVAKIKNFFD